MCGIAGIVNFDGRPVAADDVSSMTRTLAHRGPDGDGFWIEGAIGFGHRRLAIRDLGDGGRQPVRDQSGQVIVIYNGEIYNDSALKPDITRATGFAFRTTCDAEIIAPGWIAWGLDLFKRIEGMYAIALWDARHEQLVLARDPAGIKPLFVSRDRRTIRFASEIKGLLALGDQPRRLSPADLHRFMASGYPGPSRSLLEGIEQVPPGIALIADKAGVRFERFWKPERSGQIRDLDCALRMFDDIWLRTVKAVLVSDVPVGLLLSGGVDSSLIAAGLEGGSGMRAFTASFADPAWDETRYAVAVANATGLSHHVAPVDLDTEPEATFRAVVAHVDGQLGDSSCFPFFKVCQEARRFVPVLLSGDGADEFFGGYETYRASRLAERLRPLARTAGPLAPWSARAAARSSVPISIAEKLYRLIAGIGASAPGHAHVQWRRYLMSSGMPLLYGPALDVFRTLDPLADYAAAMDGPVDGVVDRCLLADQTYYLAGDLLRKADAMSMAHGLELRVPFLDRRMMEFAGLLHHDLLTPLLGPDKRMLRRALARAGIPAMITERRKRGFNMPVARMLRTGLHALASQFLDREADCLAPYLAPDGVRLIWREHAERRADHGYILWTLLTLAVWKTSVAA
jgi:asparagine synthase (glutamine-hydrolysing)